MISQQFSLQAHNTLRLRSEAQYFAAPSSEAELCALLQRYATEHPVTVLGGGSNVVLAEYVPGLVLHPRLLGKALLRQEGSHVLVQVAAGEDWDTTVAWALAQGWQGLENLSLIPGHCGAAPVQNIGAYGVELADVLHSVRAVHIPTQQQKEFTLAECQFSYRDSYFKSIAPGEWVITAIVLRLRAQGEALALGYGDVAEAFARLPKEEQNAEGLRQVICHIRSAKLPDPKLLANAGSFFKNPVVAEKHYAALAAEHPNVVAYAMPDGTFKLAAGWLIEQAGWKGHQPDGIGMHSQQALVLVNHRENACAADVLGIADAVKESVWRQFKVALEQEPLILPRPL